MIILNQLKNIYLFVTIAWLFFEILNSINKIWFKKAKKNMQKGIIKVILPDYRAYRRNISARVIVRSENKDVTAYCYGWYPILNEKVLLEKIPTVPITIDTYYKCHSEERYLKESTLKIFVIPSRIFVAFLWTGYLLWIFNPNFIRELYKFFAR